MSDELKQRLGEYLTEELPKVAPDVDWQDGRWMEQLVNGAWAAMFESSDTRTKLLEQLNTMLQVGCTEDGLVEFFRKPEPYALFGVHGDHMGWKPMETALHFVKELQ